MNKQTDEIYINVVPRSFYSQASQVPYHFVYRQSFVTQVLDFPSQIDSFFKEGNINCSLSC